MNAGEAAETLGAVLERVEAAARRTATAAQFAQDASDQMGESSGGARIREPGAR